MKAVTTPWVEEPTVEKAIVLPLKSLMVLIGESAFTYQKRSPAPVISAPMMRTGAPLRIGAQRAHDADADADIDAAGNHRLLGLAGALGVEKLQVSPCFLKMPARWPTSEIAVSHNPRWPTASFSVSWANEESVAAAAAIRLRKQPCGRLSS